MFSDAVASDGRRTVCVSNDVNECYSDICRKRLMNKVLKKLIMTQCDVQIKQYSSDSKHKFIFKICYKSDDKHVVKVVILML